jgi:enamine deaminase RidA (YjgF/YER057c/UK114 family)
LAEGKSVVSPPSLPRASGFSHGVSARGGTTLFIAGQIASDEKGKRVALGDVVGQYRQVLTNLRAVVREAGGQMTDIVKLTIYVIDRDDYRAHLQELREVHHSFLGDYYPATALVQVARFFEDDVLVEIEGVAVIDDK